MFFHILLDKYNLRVILLIFAGEQEGLGMKLQYYYVLLNFNLRSLTERFLHLLCRCSPNPLPVDYSTYTRDLC